MVEYAPSTGGLALWVHHRDVDLQGEYTRTGDHADLIDREPIDREHAPPVTTDGHTVFYRADFSDLPLAQQTGWVAHEVLHIALRHPQRLRDLQRVLGDVDLQLFNLCADAIVNSTLGHLGWLELPAGGMTIERLLTDEVGVTSGVEAALLAWDVERLYRAVDDRRPDNGRGEGSDKPSDTRSAKQGDKPHRRDGPKAASVRALDQGGHADLRPASDALEAPEDAAEHAREWAERIARAHAGDGAFSMLRTLIADLPTSRTPWQQVLRTLLARSLAPQREVSWSRPSRSYLANQGRAGAHRRMPWEPGFSASKVVPRLVVIVDVSGSIDAALMQRFACEIEAIARRLEAGLVLVIGDDRVQRVEHIAPGRTDWQAIEFNGGGGTDFTPLLEAAETHRPDIAVVLTDLDGPTRFQPRWPVIWAVPQACAAAVPPFGRKLVLD